MQEKEYLIWGLKRSVLIHKSTKSAKNAQLARVSADFATFHNKYESSGYFNNSFILGISCARFPADRLIMLQFARTAYLQGFTGI